MAIGEGTIFRRTDGRWSGAISLPGGKRKYYYAKTRGEVVAKLRAGQDSLRRGLPPDADRLTVANFLDTWLESNASRKVRPRTLRGYEQIVRLHLKPAIGHVLLPKLAPHHIDRMMNDGLAVGRSRAAWPTTARYSARP